MFRILLGFALIILAAVANPAHAHKGCPTGTHLGIWTQKCEPNLEVRDASEKGNKFVCYNTTRLVRSKTKPELDTLKSNTELDRQVAVKVGDYWYSCVFFGQEKPSDESGGEFDEYIE